MKFEISGTVEGSPTPTTFVADCDSADEAIAFAMLRGISNPSVRRVHDEQSEPWPLPERQEPLFDDELPRRVRRPLPERQEPLFDDEPPLRRRRPPPAQKNSAGRWVLILLGAGVVIGAAVYGLREMSTLHTSRIEEAVQRGMKNRDIQLKSVKLEKQADGSYRGVGIDLNGEEWIIQNVRVKDAPRKPFGNQEQQQEVTWNYRLPKSQLQQKMRQFMESTVQPKTTVKSIELTKRPDNSYRGTALTDAGIQYDVYVGAGDDQVIIVNPAPITQEEWARMLLQDNLKTAIKSVKLTPQSDGNVHGVLVDKDGLKWDLRIGNPPGEVWTVNDPSVPLPASLSYSLSPDSYKDFAKSGIESKLKVTVTDLRLEKQANGVYRGIADTKSGDQYQVEVGDWPDPSEPINPLMKLKLDVDNVNALLRAPLHNGPANDLREMKRTSEGQWPGLGPARVKWQAKLLPMI